MLLWRLPPPPRRPGAALGVSWGLVGCLSPAVGVLLWLWGGLLPRPWPAAAERVSVAVFKVDLPVLVRRLGRAVGERVSVAADKVNVCVLVRRLVLAVGGRVSVAATKAEPVKVLVGSGATRTALGGRGAVCVGVLRVVPGVRRVAVLAPPPCRPE